MTIEPHGTKFDCVAFMREARNRISDKMATMSREEFRHWLRSYRYSDPVLQRLADEARSGRPEDSEAPTPVDRADNATPQRARRDRGRNRNSGGPVNRPRRDDDEPNRSGR